jgi:hypothetical protein
MRILSPQNCQQKCMSAVTIGNHAHVVLVYPLSSRCLLDAGMISSISFLKVESERTKLIDAIESYQSIHEFKGLLNRSSFQWEESEDKTNEWVTSTSLTKVEVYCSSWVCTGLGDGFGSVADIGWAGEL